MGRGPLRLAYCRRLACGFELQSEGVRIGCPDRWMSQPVFQNPKRTLRVAAFSQIARLQYNGFRPRNRGRCRRRHQCGDQHKCKAREAAPQRRAPTSTPLTPYVPVELWIANRPPTAAGRFAEVGVPLWKKLPCTANDRSTMFELLPVPVKIWVLPVMLRPTRFQFALSKDAFNDPLRLVKFHCCANCPT